MFHLLFLLIMTRGIKINSADGYLHMNDLPHDCIFNKVVTGCGGTTITLQNDEDYIIAVPTTELIINKIGRPDAGIGTVKNHDGTDYMGDITLALKETCWNMLPIATRRR